MDYSKMSRERLIQRCKKLEKENKEIMGDTIILRSTNSQMIKSIDELIEYKKEFMKISMGMSIRELSGITLAQLVTPPLLEQINRTKKVHESKYDVKEHLSLKCILREIGWIVDELLTARDKIKSNDERGCFGCVGFKKYLEEKDSDCIDKQKQALFTALQASQEQAQYWKEKAKMPIQVLMPAALDFIRQVDRAVNLVVNKDIPSASLLGGIEGLLEVVKAQINIDKPEQK